MKAAYLTKRTGPEGLTVGEIPEPRPSEGQILVRVHATAITPTELSWFPTFQAPNGAPRPFPIILSHEFSGVVSASGSRVNGFKVGDEVYGMNDWFANGAQAEYCLAPAAALAPKSASIPHTSAAAVPISALTAWQGLFDRCGLQAGERILIQGASGAVGLFAVQLAHARGAYVIGTASPQNVNFVRELGADEVIDYRTAQFEGSARDIDVLFDAVGGPTLQRSWALLRPGGRAVTIVGQSGPAAEPRARDAFFIVEPKQKQLNEVSHLLESRRLRAFVAAVFPFAEAREAFAHASSGGLRGKVVLQITSKDGL